MNDTQKMIYGIAMIFIDLLTSNDDSCNPRNSIAKRKMQSLKEEIIEDLREEFEM